MNSSVKALSKTKVVIGLPTAGFTQAEALNCLWLQAFHLGKYQADHPEFEFYFRPGGRMFTPMNRERIMAHAIEINADYIFMVDDDMVFRPDIFEQLYRHQVDVVAALAFTRNPPHLPVLYQTREGWDPIAHREYAGMEWIMNYPKNRLVEVDAVGFGCVLIDMRVVAKMQAPYFMCSSGTGEDIYFCVQAKKAGARIFSDTSTVIGHLSNPMIIGEEEFKKFNDPEMMEKLYGAYHKYGVYEVSNFELPLALKETDKKEEVVLAT